MNKFFNVVICFLIFSNTAHSSPNSQAYTKLDSTKKKMKLYLGGVLNYNIGSLDLGSNRSFRGADLSNFNSLGGGISLHLQNEKGVFFYTEISYEQRQASDPQFVSPNTSDTYPANLSAKFSYFNIPLIGGYVFKGKNLSPFIGGGLQIGSAISSDINFQYPDGTPSFVFANAIPEIGFDESIEYGIVGVIGLQKKLTNSNLLNFTAKYVRSERTYSVNKNRATGGSVNLGTQKIVVSMNFLFRL